MRDTPTPLPGSGGGRWYQSPVETHTCPDCAADTDHCHGTLIIHRDGLVECTEPGCTPADPVRHALLLDCVDVEGGCVCVGTIIVDEVAGAA